MLRVMFVERDLFETLERWDEVLEECWLDGMDETGFELLPIEQFRSLERTLKLVVIHRPDAIVIGYRLGFDFDSPAVTGDDLIVLLRARGFTGLIVGNADTRRVMRYFEQSDPFRCSLESKPSQNSRQLARRLVRARKERDKSRMYRSANEFPQTILPSRRVHPPSSVDST